MKILIVDNLTFNIEYLKSLLKDHEVEVRIYEELSEADLDEYDLYILTGTTARYMDFIWNKWRDLSMERRLIMESTKPIIGICYGAELIALAYDCKLKLADIRIKGNYEISLKKDIGLDLTKKYIVYGNHRYFIEEVSNDLEIIATSANGPEIIKHKTKPIYGLMFHPEKESETTDGDEILLTLMKSFEKPVTA